VKSAKVPGKITDLKFIPNNPKNMENALSAYNGKEVVITITKPKTTRTLPQNAYLFGVVYTMIANETGSDTESTHHYMADMFLKELGGTIPKVQSTTKLTTAEFQVYVDKIIQWAAEFLGLYIPLPLEEEMWGGLVNDRK